MVNELDERTQVVHRPRASCARISAANVLPRSSVASVVWLAAVAPGISTPSASQRYSYASAAVAVPETVRVAPAVAVPDSNGAVANATSSTLTV